MNRRHADLLPRGQKVDLDGPTEEERAELQRTLGALHAGSYVRNLLRPESLQLVPGRGCDRSLPTITISRINMAILGDGDPVAFCIALMEAPETTPEEVGLVTGALHCIIAATALETDEPDVRYLSAHCPTGASPAQVRKRFPTPDMAVRKVESDPTLLQALPPFARIGVIIPDDEDDEAEAVTTIVLSPLTTSILDHGPLPDAVETLRVMSAVKSLAYDGTCDTIDRT